MHPPEDQFGRRMHRAPPAAKHTNTGPLAGASGGPCRFRLPSAVYGSFLADHHNLHPMSKVNEKIVRSDEEWKRQLTEIQ